MSYLDVPRLHFFGRFQAAPSTINNTAANYKLSDTPPDPAWNPNGTHWFKLDCTVRTAIDPKSTAADPLVGTPLVSVDGHPQIGKLVDLDPEQQMVSMIFGMQVRIGSGDDWVQGDFRPVNFIDIFGRVIGGKPDSMFAAAYQSVLENLTWGPSLTSPVLQALKKSSPQALSIRFVVDAFQDKSQDPTTYMPYQDFTWGRVTGTVGPWSSGEPTNFTLGRLLRPVGETSALNYAPFRVDTERSVLLADFGNVFQTTSPGGPLATMPAMQLAAFPASGAPVVLGTLDYSESAYETLAMVQEFPLKPDQLAAVAASPVGVLPAGQTAASDALLMENATGAYVDATQYVYRMAAGTTAQVDVVALLFGQPAAGQTITLATYNDQLQPMNKLAVGTPSDALTYYPAGGTPGTAPTVTTDANGRASFTLQASDPKNPRGYIDGQVYGVKFQWDQDTNPDPLAFVSVLVFDAFTPPDPSTWSQPATWTGVVKPIFDQYMRLYPFMQERVDLGDYPTVVGLRQQIAGYLSLPITNPSHMPVTRDLSPPKSAFLVSWLNAIDPAGVPQSMAGIMYGGIPVPPAGPPSASPSTSSAPPANPGPSSTGPDAPAH